MLHAKRDNSDGKPHSVDWVRLTDPHGRSYYYNTKSAISRWDEPPEYREPTPRTIKQVHAKGVVVPEQVTDPALKRVLSQMAGDPQIAAAKKETSMLRAVQSLTQLRGTVKAVEQKVQGMVAGKKVEDRRCWGRPERLRTDSGEGGDLSSVDPAYRFRTSSSSDLIQLLSLTQTVASKKPSAQSSLGKSAKQQQQQQQQQGLPRTPSFLEMEIKTPQHQQQEVKARPRRNTTNSVTIDNLMSKPDNAVQIRCVASLLHAQMVRFALAHKRNPKAVSSSRFDVFNETLTPEQEAAGVPVLEPAQPQLKRIPSLHTAGSLERQLLTRGAPGLKRPESKVDVFAQTDAPKVPDKEMIAAFVARIFQKAQMEGETIIMILVYVERLLEATKGKLELTMRNWQPITLACMVLASKVWDDLSMWNADFSLISGAYTVKRVNELEVALLEAMQYNVRVPASTYAKYYFQLRSLRAQLGEKPEELERLDMSQASKLETLSDRYLGSLGVSWSGPAPKSAEEKKAKGKTDVQRPAGGVRKRSNTLNEGLSHEALEQMHKTGPKFPSMAAPVSVEQIVSLKHKGPMTDDF